MLPFPYFKLLLFKYDQIIVTAFTKFNSAVTTLLIFVQILNFQC